MTMKTGYFLGYCIIALLLSAILASADPITVTVTRVNITQNGMPITSSVDYTMDCYGHSFYEGDASWMAEHKIAKILNISGMDDYQYSYSATCKPGRCDIYEYYDTWTMTMSRCDIHGTYQGKPFFIGNFSQDPIPPGCINMHLERGDNGLKYCMDEQCHKTLDPEEAKVSSRYCELNFDLSQGTSQSANISSANAGTQNTTVQSENTPSHGITVQTQRSPLQNRTVQPKYTPYQGPVESFYCGILRFFGTAC
jgi:hypothetical protein